MTKWFEETVATPPYRHNVSNRTSAEHLSEVIAEGEADVDAVFAGIVEALSEGGDGTAADRMARLREVVSVHKAYKADRFARIIGGERL